MSNCCGGKTSKKKPKQNQSFSQESRDSNWLDQVKGAFGINTKPVLNRKKMPTINKIIRNPVAAKAVGFGILGSLGLFVFYYLTLLVITKDPAHPLVQMKLYQPWMSLLIVGFGIQIGIYSLLRSGVQIRLNRNERNEATAVTGAGAAVSGVSMAACCAHHVVELLPILGVSGAALFLTEYQKELLIVGVIANLFGIVFMAWILLGKQKPKVILNYLLSRRINR